MTDEASNRVKIEKPSNYNRDDFTELLGLIKQGKINRFEDVVAINRVPNGKADINDKLYSLYSLRLPGENYEWPEGDSLTRKKIFDKHKSYTLSLLYFLQNDTAVTENLRKEAAAWGLPKDEFLNTGHFPPALYVREGRRLEGQYILKEQDLAPSENSVRSVFFDDAIAVCDYSMDSHGNAPPSSLHPGITEGVFNSFVVPYQIPYRVIVTEKINNLLVTCAVSASHVAFSSLRMEPTWCALGQAAGIASVLALENSKSVLKIDIKELQSLLHKDKAITCYVSDINIESKDFQIVQYWGSKGLFHNLPEYENMPYIGRGKWLGRGQFLEKYPYHDIHPDWKMTPELASKWLEIANVDRNIPHENKTRSEYLKLLYEQTVKEK